MTGPAPYRTGQSHKRAESEEIERQIAEFVRQGGTVQQLENCESQFQPTWKAYADGAFEDREG